ncbi:MAG: response regulator [Chloroflexota bacterium]|nr:response regulator [Chloroflexota bacterium]
MSKVATNILVVDDDDFVRASFTNELTAAGYEVATAENGQVALALLAESDFDVVLVDIRMPQVDGLTVVRKGLAITPETRMIVITGYASIDTAVEALRYGAYDYLRKPCRSQELLATVARAVENRRLQQEVQLLREDMIDMLVHDLKGPLSIISSSYSVLRDELSALEGGEAALQWLEIAKQGQVRLERLINTLLDMTRLEAGESLGERESVTPLKLVRETIGQLKPNADIRNLELRTEVASRLPKVQVDQMLMVRVLINLLDNALKYSPSEGTVIVGAHHSQEGPPAVTFWVRDQGPGIPLEYQERVFDKFTHVPDRQWSGMGLGLAYCRLVVEAHGGRIWVDSPAEGGSIFSFTVLVSGQ